MEKNEGPIMFDDRVVVDTLPEVSNSSASCFRYRDGDGHVHLGRPLFWCEPYKLTVYFERLDGSVVKVFRNQLIVDYPDGNSEPG